MDETPVGSSIISPDRAAVDCGRRKMKRRKSSEMSGMISSGSSGCSSSKRNLVQVQEDDDSTSPSWTEDSMAMDWTDEKHRSFLSSMEATFVKQLNNHKTSPAGLLRWNSGVEDLSGSESSRQLNGNNHVRNSQNFNVNRARPQSNIAPASHVIFENQWVRHFRSGGNHQEIRSPNLQNGVHSSEAIHSGGGWITPFGVSNSPQKLPTRHRFFCRENSIDDHAEVSDQNFAEDQIGDDLSSSCSTKK